MAITKINDVKSPIKSMDLRRRSLSISERGRLERSIRLMEREIRQCMKGGQNYTKNLDTMQEELNAKKRSLKNNCPPPLTSKQKDKWFAKAKELEAKIKENMLTTDELYPKSIRAANEAVKKGVWYHDNITPYELQLKEIYRRLEPEDESITNLERFRR